MKRREANYSQGHTLGKNQHKIINIDIYDENGKVAQHIDMKIDQACKKYINDYIDEISFENPRTKKFSEKLHFEVFYQDSLGVFDIDEDKTFDDVIEQIANFFSLPKEIVFL